MIAFQFHSRAFLVTPVLVFEHGECLAPGCDAQHWSVHVGWLLWSVSIYSPAE